MTEASDLARALDFCKLLMDEDRLRLIAALMAGEATLSTLSAAVNLAEPKVARHLDVLQRAGLVTTQDEPQTLLFQFNRQRFRTERGAFFKAAARIGPPPPTFATPEEEVLNRFLDGERLVQLPVKGEKLLLVLEWLAGKFEPERRYAEKEVNQIIQQHHPDYASLRRFLVDNNFLQRERGIYWRS